MKAAAAKAIPRATNAPKKAVPRATNVPMNGAMLAAMVPIVPYGLSKTTHDAITAQKAKRMAKTATVRKYLFEATLPPVRARRPAIHCEKNWLGRLYPDNDMLSGRPRELVRLRR